MTDTIIPVRSEYEKLLEEVHNLRAHVIELMAHRDDLRYHICPALQAKYDEKILVEETIVGRELEVAVLGDRHPHASPVGEIVAADEFYSYEAKYGGMGSVAEVAENLSEEVADRIRETAIEVYKLLGCSGYSRVDFFLKGEDEIYFNEINSLPGFTSISMYPKLWDAAGVPYSELITRLIENAMDENND